MSDAPAPQDETGEALARLAAYGSKESGKESRKERRGWGPAVLLVVLLIPLAAVAWLAWQQQQLQQQVVALRADNAALRERDSGDDDTLAQVQREQQALSAALQQREDQLATALQQRENELTSALQQRENELEAALRSVSRETLQQTQAALADSTAAVAAQGARLANLERELAALERDANRNENDLARAEAELLLRAAQQRISLARDTAGALELFRAADAVLAASEDPVLVPVRSALARDIAALEAVPPIDIAGLFARLGALSARVAGFEVVVEGSVQDFSVDAATNERAAAAGWWEGLKQSLNSYFVVTRSTADILPQPGDSERFQVRALVQLHIEQARLALLRGEQQVYRTALDDALAVTQRWLRDATIAEFSAALEELRDTPIASDLPAADASLVALRQVPAARPAPAVERPQ